MTNPIDHFNSCYPFEDIFNGSKLYWLKSKTDVVAYSDINEVVFQLQPSGLITTNIPIGDVPSGASITKFILFTHLKFKGNWQSAMSFVQYDILKDEIPYLRVKCDYYKLVDLEDRYGTPFKSTAGWKKEEIKQDHGAWIFSNIPRFDGFVMIPDNKNFQQVYKGCFNLYSKFPHKSHSEIVESKDIPYSIALMKRVFGDQLTQGFTYMKVLYEYPKQILPILTLISEERGTGKTTVINWMQMIFGENAVQISPESLTKDHNTIYAHKNVILIDEAFADKKETVEKLKHTTTAKYITVNPKFVSEYSIPFYGKIILCTNREVDFAQIDNQEIRFWIRKLDVITELNTSIENELIKEIPKFLKYLEQLDTPDFTKSRMVFTPEEIGTKELEAIKKESKSGLHQDIETRAEALFDESGLDSFKATAIDIKDHWFSKDHKYTLNYIRKVLKHEMKMKPLPPIKYSSFNNTDPGKIGRPFEFFRKDRPVIIDQDPLFNNLNPDF